MVKLNKLGVVLVSGLCVLVGGVAVIAASWKTPVRCSPVLEYSADVLRMGDVSFTGERHVGEVYVDSVMDRIGLDSMQITRWRFDESEWLQVFNQLQEQTTKVDGELVAAIVYTNELHGVNRLETGHIFGASLFVQSADSRYHVMLRRSGAELVMDHELRDRLTGDYSHRQIALLHSVAHSGHPPQSSTIYLLFPSDEGIWNEFGGRTDETLAAAILENPVLSGASRYTSFRLPRN